MATEARSGKTDSAADEAAEITRRFTGFAAEYDAYHPLPPPLVAEILSGLVHGRELDLVVDLGCGTGQSCRLWAGRARRVVGIDPSHDMLAQARQSTTDANITYCHGFSHDTRLPDHCADLVTCGSSLHWMDPDLLAFARLCSGRSAAKSNRGILPAACGLQGDDPAGKVSP